VLRPIDLEAVSRQLAQVAADAIANDPRRLKARIAELERAVTAATSATNETAKSDVATREVVAEAEGRGFARGRRAAFEELVTELADKWIPATHRSITEAVERELQAMRGRLADLLPPVELPAAAKPTPRFEAVFAPPVHFKTGLPIGERTCLIAVAQHRDGVTRNQLTVLTGYKRSTRDAYISRLATRQYVVLTGDGRVFASQGGVAELGPDYQPLPTGPALREYWLGKLPDGERRVLEVLISAYPADVPRADIDGPTGYKRSTRDAYIARLVSRKLVEFGPTGLHVTSRLFENA
jgi:hypothetical protein